MRVAQERQAEQPVDILAKGAFLDEERHIAEAGAGEGDIAGAR